MHTNLRLRLKNLFANLVKRESFSLIMKNIGWQSLDKVIRMGTGIIVSVWVTRYLGPERFGTLSYAIAFAGMFSSVAGLGLDGIVIRELSLNYKPKDLIMGSTFFLKLAGAFLAFSLSVLFIFFFKSQDTTTIIFVIIISLGFFFNSFDIIDFWFQSQIKFKYIFYAKNLAFFIAAIIKILLIIFKAELIYFVIVATIEIVLGSIGSIIMYYLTGNKIKKWGKNLIIAKELIFESWPLIIAGFATFLYIKIDQIMLGTMLNNKEVGIYSAAIKFSEIWYFIPGAIYTSVFPVLAKYKKENQELFFLKYKKVCSIMALISIIIALIMTFLSKYLVSILYGNKFIQAGPILSVHIWAGVFVFIGVAGSMWIMLEGLQKFTLFATSLGAIINIILNLYLIPLYSGFGAAIATVISYAIAGYFVFFFYAKTRTIFSILSNSILFPWRNLNK
jgi:polysaccharide transporter, PST family